MKTELQIRHAFDAARLCGDAVRGDFEQAFYIGLWTALGWSLDLTESATIDEMVAYVRERKQRLAERN